MKKSISSTLLCFLLATYASAQHSKVAIPESAILLDQATKSAAFTVEPLGEITPVSVDLNWKPLLNHKGIKHHSKNDEELIKIKELKAKIKKNYTIKSNETDGSDILPNLTPIVNSNFLGNTNTGSSPMDNSIAISNGGKIVSVANTSIEFYSTNGSLTYTNTIDGFFNNANISNVCDPVVIYDSGADKFIFFAQECSEAFSYSIIPAISLSTHAL